MKPICAVLSIFVSLFVSAACTDQSGSDPAVQGSGSGAIRVSIDSDGGIWINDQIVEPPDIAARIERLHTANPDSPLVLSADAESPASAIDAVLGAYDESGVTSIVIGAGE